MSEYKEIYLPLYFSWREMTEELSNEELGMLVRALWDNFSKREIPSDLDPKMRIIYKLLLDGAVRTLQSQRELSEKRRESANRRWAKSSTSDANECKPMQNEANECGEMQSDAVNGNINGNKKENGNINGYGYGNTYSRYAKKEQKVRHGNFDPMEAFKKALARSYPDEDVDETVKKYYG